MTIYKRTNTFGVYLNELLKLKNIKKKHFASLMDINRSQLYRFLNNEQLPEEEVVKEMASVLNLYTSEEEEMLECYESSLYGWEVIEGRKIIINILNKIQNKEKEFNRSITYIPKFDDVFNLNNDIEVRSISDKKNVLNMLLSMLNSVVESEKDINVRLILNPNHRAFMNLLLLQLEKINKLNNKTSVTHIIRFREILSEKTKLFNLEILEQLLPLSQYENIYKVYYTSQNANTSAYTDFYPNFISLGDNNALLISSDFEKGLLFGNKAVESIEQMIEEYKKVLNDSLQLFINFDNLVDQFKYISKYETSLNKFLLHPEQGFYTLPLDIVKSKADKLDETKVMSQILKSRIETFKGNLEKSKFTEIIPSYALDEFVDTGKMVIQRNINFTIAERMKVLKKLLKYVEKEKNYNLFITKENNELYNNLSAVYIIGTDMLFIVPKYKNYDISDNIIIRERSIVESFKDFFDSYFKDKNTITKQEEVAKIIKEKINELKK